MPDILEDHVAVEREGSLLAHLARYEAKGVGSELFIATFENLKPAQSGTEAATSCRRHRSRPEARGARGWIQGAGIKGEESDARGRRHYGSEGT